MKLRCPKCGASVTVKPGAVGSIGCRCGVRLRVPDTHAPTVGTGPPPVARASTRSKPFLRRRSMGRLAIRTTAAKVVVVGAVLATAAAGAVTAKHFVDREDDSLEAKIEIAEKQARSNIAIYADWLDQQTYAAAAQPCSAGVRGLLSLQGTYTVIRFTGDTDFADGTDDTEIGLFKGTPADLALTADAAFFVPGTGTTWSSGFDDKCANAMQVSDRNWISSADLLAKQGAEEQALSDLFTGRNRKAPIVVAWLGYNSPKFDIDSAVDDVVSNASPANSRFANEGGKALAEDVNKLTDGDQHVTLIGHSYGSPVTGYALWKYKARGVNDLIGAGSPGLGVGRDGQSCEGHSTGGISLPATAQYTRQCISQIGEAHFWALQTPSDWLIGKNGICRWFADGANECGWLGDTLHGDKFGAHEMNNHASGYPEIGTHGSYFRKSKDNRVPLSIVNSARVIVGSYDLVDLESTAPGTTYPGNPKPKQRPSTTTTSTPSTAQGVTREHLLAATPTAADLGGSYVLFSNEVDVTNLDDPLAYEEYLSGDPECDDGMSFTFPPESVVVDTKFQAGTQEAGVAVARWLQDDAAEYLQGVFDFFQSCRDYVFQMHYAPPNEGAIMDVDFRVLDVPEVGDEVIQVMETLYNTSTKRVLRFYQTLIRRGNSLTYVNYGGWEDGSPNLNEAIRLNAVVDQLLLDEIDRNASADAGLGGD